MGFACGINGNLWYFSRGSHALLHVVYNQRLDSDTKWDGLTSSKTSETRVTFGRGSNQGDTQAVGSFGSHGGGPWIGTWMFVLTGRMIRLETTSSNGHNEQDMPCAVQQKCCGTCGTCGTASSRTKRIRGREPESKSLVLRHLRHRRHRDRDRSAGRQPARNHPRRCGTCGTLRHCARHQRSRLDRIRAMVPVKSLWPRCGRRRILRLAEARYSRFKLATPSLSELFKLPPRGGIPDTLFSSGTSGGDSRYDYDYDYDQKWERRESVPDPMQNRGA